MDVSDDKLDAIVAVEREGWNAREGRWLGPYERQRLEEIAVDMRRMRVNMKRDGVDVKIQEEFWWLVEELNFVAGCPHAVMVRRQLLE